MAGAPPVMAFGGGDPLENRLPSCKGVFSRRVVTNAMTIMKAVVRGILTPIVESMPSTVKCHARNHIHIPSVPTRKVITKAFILRGSEQGPSTCLYGTGALTA
ncbi:hypothetical protein MPER_07914 [Moniliophthora perniciosa FA553]|nr:hypothetical protein MPER_07914 [Moniliophthora perniciosa FA553]